jgi:hypothetical protein
MLMAYALSGQRKRAAELAGIDYSTHWHWLRKDPAYAEAFAEAEKMAGDVAEDKAYELAIEGYEEDVYHNGVVVGAQRKYLPTLLLAILNAAKPDKYKYRQETTQKFSDATQALMEKWLHDRDLPPPERVNIIEGHGTALGRDADASLPAPTLPPPPSMASHKFDALREANRLPTDDDDADEDEED